MQTDDVRRNGVLFFRTLFEVPESICAIGIEEHLRPESSKYIYSKIGSSIEGCLKSISAEVLKGGLRGVKEWGRDVMDPTAGMVYAVLCLWVYLGGSRESIVEAVKDSVGAWKDDDIKNLVLNVCIKTAEGGRQKVQSSFIMDFFNDLWDYVDKGEKMSADRKKLEKFAVL